jgi:hypothetical protein
MNNQEHIDYYILSISQKKVSLFKLHDTATEEIRDGVFPMSFLDDYEYARSSRGSSFGYTLKNFEKDKSIVKKERFMHFLKEVNERLRRYLDNDCALLLIGPDEDRASFKRVSIYNDLIAGEISGSLNSIDLTQLRRSIATTLKNTN